MNDIPFTQARANLAELIQQSKHGQPVFISQRGQTSAVLLSMREYERLGNQPHDVVQAWQQWHQQHLAILQSEKENFVPDRVTDQGRDFSW